MAGGQVDDGFRFVACAGPAAAVDLHGGVVGADDQIFRRLLMPFQSGLRTIDLEDEIVLFAS